jgi:hypothetical protein
MSVLGPGFTRNVWMFLYKEGGRWAPCELKNCEIGYEGVNLAADLRNLAEGGMIARFVEGNRSKYGVTAACKIPRGVLLADLK